MDLDTIRQQATEEVQLIQDGNIYYLVLNQQGTNDFTFQPECIEKLHKIVDQLESTKGAGVLVTLSTQKKKFCTGFSVDFFIAANGNSFISIAALQPLLARFLKLSMPSICLIEGHCYAGGLIFALCHDMRVMKQKSGKLCLSEINIGVSLPPAYAELVKILMPIQLLREMIMGRAVQIPEAFNWNIIQAIYNDDAQALMIVKAFEKNNAARAVKRHVFQELKIKLHEEAIKVCERASMGPFQMMNIASGYKEFSASQREKL